jgi:hypothetical protein
MAYVKNPERQVNKGVDSGYAGLDSSGNVPTYQLGNLGGVAGPTTFLRGDQQWATPTASTVVPVKFVNDGNTPYTVLTSDCVLLGECGDLVIEADLPDASSNAGKIYICKKIDANTANQFAIVAAGSDLIDGDASYNMTKQYDSITVIADASGNWNIV